MELTCEDCLFAQKKKKTVNYGLGKGFIRLSACPYHLQEVKRILDRHQSDQERITAYRIDEQKYERNGFSQPTNSAFGEERL